MYFFHFIGLARLCEGETLSVSIEHTSILHFLRGEWIVGIILFRRAFAMNHDPVDSL
jgi:hypothetical protein